MRAADWAKWIYSFLLLLLTVGWGYLSLVVLERALKDKLPVDILVSAVVSVLLGAMLTWDSLVVQHWFRKATPADDGSVAPPAALLEEVKPK